MAQDLSLPLSLSAQRHCFLLRLSKPVNVFGAVHTKGRFTRIWRDNDVATQSMQSPARTLRTQPDVSPKNHGGRGL